MNDYQTALFPKLATDRKTPLSVLGQYVYDREAPKMSADERKRITQATSPMILLVMSIEPRRI